jgi:hypothetical protein
MMITAPLLNHGSLSNGTAENGRAGGLINCARNNGASCSEPAGDVLVANRFWSQLKWKTALSMSS